MERIEFLLDSLIDACSRPLNACRAAETSALLRSLDETYEETDSCWLKEISSDSNARLATNPGSILPLAS